jgi:glutathione synthase/RimK-type ligase-like ATP-grasp enzyme
MPATPKARPLQESKPLKLAILTTRSRELFHQSIDTVSRAGHALDIVNPADLVLTISEHGPRLAQVGDLNTCAVEQLDVIFNQAGREWIRILGDAFDVMAVPVLNDWRASETAGDKLKALVRVAGSGLRLPETTFLAGDCFRTRVAEAEALFGYPMVVKESRADRGEKVFLAHSRREVWDIWSDGAPRDLFLLQRCQSRPRSCSGTEGEALPRVRPGADCFRQNT